MGQLKDQIPDGSKKIVLVQQIEPSGTIEPYTIST